MADRYWVGGSGSWNSTTKWSATSGGASGASVPTASDNAIFDANSGTAHYTVTVTDNATCADLTFTPHASDGVTQFSVGNGFVIAGTFSTSGTQGNRRGFFRSSTTGLTRDMQIATIGTVTDVDFRDIRVTGTGGTLTGTRIGDLRGNFGITFSTPKSVYWASAVDANWSSDNWASSSGGAPNTDNFPLAQDTAIIDNGPGGTGTLTWDGAILYTGTVDMSARTNAMSFVNAANTKQVYGDWTSGSGVNMSGGFVLTFTGRGSQTITSAGKTFSSPITIDSYGGTVELADALNIGTTALTVTNGTFDTKGYNVTAGGLSSSYSNVREIRLGASTVTLSGSLTLTTSTNLTLDAGTSSLVMSSGPFDGGGQTFYDVSFTTTSAGTTSINQSNTFNNLSLTATASAGLRQHAFGGDQTITGTLTAAGASAVRRIMLRSNLVGTTRTLTVGTLLADYCDFRDITIVTNPALATASYDSVSFSVAGQETSPEALFFKPDGAKMYVLGATGDDVNEYDLSIAWDISTASYVQNFSVAAEESGPSGLFFKPDGTKMYVTGFDGDDVNEYDLSSAWDISTASYLQNFSVSSQVVTPRGLFFKPDGTRMYTSGTTNDAIFEYLLSAAWDISSASYVQSFSVVTQDNAPEDLFFNPDGTKMYVVGDQANRVYEYDLSTSWDISTASYNSVSFGVGTQETSPNDVFFKPDGSKMYVVGSGTDTVYQYSTAPVPTRAGDCGGNSGVTFPAPKTVYWNLAGSQNWSATAWATTSGGSPATNNFPLAQDTAVFDDTGSAGTVNINTTYNLGAVDMSARTTAMTLTGTPVFSVYGSWTYGSGVTQTLSGTATFLGRGTSVITSNGIAFGCHITIDCGTGTVQLADALELPSNRTLALTSGTFDAVSYNVTAGNHIYNSSGITLKMGSGTFTATGVSNVWQMSSSSTATLYAGTADILLSNTSASARTFSGNSKSYNKLTIGGATGTSTLTILGNNQFTELASTKTVAHTIALGTTTQTFGKWSVTGTAGNVVTLTGTGTTHQIAGACTDGIDYLAMGSIGFSSSSFSGSSPAEFYAGPNSTGTAAAPVYRTAKPADSTRYWVGGTGNWSDTNHWSTTSGGAGGADLPRSHDDVVFDANSNATAYTVTVDPVTGGSRCKALTIAGPASGNVTLAGSSAAIFIHDDITLPATGLTRTYTGVITLSGTGAGKTITTNGVILSSDITVNGVGAEWALADALNHGTLVSRKLSVVNGSFDTANYNFTTGSIESNALHSRSISLGSSTVVCVLASGNSVNLSTAESTRANLTFSAGTSSISCSGSSPTILPNNQTFYNVSFTNTSINTATINGAGTFNNLTVAGRTSASIAEISLSADQTINGTLTLSAGTNATMRTFVRSNTIGTTRTLTCAAVAALTDIDFRDITIAGAAVSGGNLTGTRLGDCKGNTGITFDAGKTVYWVQAGSTNWGSSGFSDVDVGGTGSTIYFPLAQDTAIFQTFPNSGNTVTINAAYNIGTLDMSARTTNTMVLSTGSNAPSIYGNWINGTGVALSGTGTLTFAGRGSQTITSAGRTFTQVFTIDTPNGSVTLQDAFETNRATVALTVNSGTFNANNYNVTLSGSGGAFASSNSNVRTIAIGSGTWTIGGGPGTAWSTGNITNLTLTGTGIISLTSASAKNFAGGGNFNYSGITLNQGGAGTITVSGNNTFANITNTATGATTLNFGTTTQRVADFTATGTAGNVLTIQGSSATSPCTLIHTGAGDIDIDYVTITGVRAYQT